LLYCVTLITVVLSHLCEREGWRFGTTMVARIFINYRREDSPGIAGRLHDRLGQSFGRKTLFMDVDHIPPGVDFVTHLNNQVAACDVFLAIIGPNWLNVTNEKGERRLDATDDFVAIEIAAALARNIRVIPVLVDGARMPKAGDLPKSLKPLVRRQAIDLRHTHFGRDADALIEKIGEAFGGRPVRVGRWRVAAGVVAALLLFGGIGLFATDMPLSLPWAVQPDTREQAEKERKAAVQAEEERKAAVQAEEERKAKAAAEAEARAKAEQAEKERLAAAQAEQERKAKAAAEAEARRKSEETERQRLAGLGAEEEQRKQAEAQARARYSTLMTQGHTDINNGNYDRAIAAFSDAMRLDPKSAPAFTNRGVAYERKGDMDRAIADFSEAIRLDPNYALALSNRGIAYERKGDNDRAIADFNEAIRLDPKNVLAFANRGIAYGKKGDTNRAIADYNEVIRLDPKNALAFANRGIAYGKKGDNDRAIADFNEAIRLDPNYALAFFNRGIAYGKKGDNDRAIADYSEAIRLNPNVAMTFNNRGFLYFKKGDTRRAIADFEEAIRLDPKSALAFCNRGNAKLKIKEASGNADIAKARQLDASICR
jgi:tetratricopeptide (TPR) repeat protein